MFGPATTTRHVYDVAAQHVVSGAMEGVNGNYFSLLNKMIKYLWIECEWDASSVAVKTLLLLITRTFINIHVTFP